MGSLTGTTFRGMLTAREADRLQQLHTHYASLRVSSMRTGWIWGSLCPVLTALRAPMLLGMTMVAPIPETAGMPAEERWSLLRGGAVDEATRTGLD